MQFLVIGKPQQAFLGSNPPTDLKEALEGELAKSREYYGAGHLRSIWLIAGRGVMKIATGSKFPRALGSDFSGTVESVGSQVSQFKPGDPVRRSAQ